MKGKLTVRQGPFTMPLRQKIEMVFETQTAQDTYELGVKTGRRAKPGDVYCISGDLEQAKRSSLPA